MRGIKRAGTPLSGFVASEIFPFTFPGVTAARVVGYDGLYLHGVIPLAVALDPGPAEPPALLRVKMTCNRVGAHYFEISDDPAIPARMVYQKVRDPETIERNTIERCR